MFNREKDLPLFFMVGPSDYLSSVGCLLPVVKEKTHEPNTGGMAFIGEDLIRLVSKKRNCHCLYHLKSRLSLFPCDVELVLCRSFFSVN